MIDKNWFDPNTYVEMMKDLPAAKIPGLDTEALTEAYQKNVQALVEANKVASEGYQGVAKMQMEAVQASVAEANEAVSGATAQPLTAEDLEKNLDLAKTQFEKGVEVYTELAESAKEASENAMAILQARFTENMEEFKELSAKAMDSVKAA